MNLIDRCFEGAPNVPRRLLRVPASVEKAEEHLEKANRNLFAAKLMNDNKFFDWAITCGYYAMYHATMASLWLIGLEARSHECAIAAFEIFYVKEQKVGKEYLEYLNQIFRRASLADARDPAQCAGYEGSFENPVFA